jgi:hypothetical protein
LQAREPLTALEQLQLLHTFWVVGWLVLLLVLLAEALLGLKQTEQLHARVLFTVVLPLQEQLVEFSRRPDWF